MPAIYPHLAARIFNTPLLIHPQKLDAMIAAVGQRLLGQPVATNAHATPEAFSTRPTAQAGEPYAVHDGVAVINIFGALAHRTRINADCTGFLGYDAIVARLEHAMQDPGAHAVLLCLDSPGGEVQGAFECAERVAALRGRKPMLAIADGMAASAAYLLASAADEVVVTPTGYAGSIGVVSRHVDVSGALAQDGLKVTHVFAGAHKVDGNPYEPLPASVRADWQAEMDGLYTEFVQAVAAYRGLSFDAVRDTQARLFRGNAAQASGLANRVGTTDAVIAELASRRNAPKVFLPATHQATAVTPKVNRMMSHATHQTTHCASAATSQEAQAEALAMQVLQSAGFATPTKAVPVPAATTAEDLADRMVADYRRIILGEVA